MAYVTPTINQIIPADPITIVIAAGKILGISGLYNLSVNVAQVGGGTNPVQLSLALSIEEAQLYQFENGQSSKTYNFTLNDSSADFHPNFQIANRTALTNPPYPVTIDVFVYDVAQGPHSASTDNAQYQITS